jgi:acyl dehydratase
MSQEITIDELKTKVGQELGVSDWIAIPQEEINKFADVTHDHQFIHVDVERAKDTPFGGTIAHGFFTISLIVPMAHSALPTIKDRTMGVNYGFDKLRLMSPVKSGARIRGRFVLKSLESKTDKQHQLVHTVTVEIEGGQKPALVADWVTLAYTK